MQGLYGEDRKGENLGVLISAFWIEPISFPSIGQPEFSFLPGWALPVTHTFQDLSSICSLANAVPWLGTQSPTSLPLKSLPIQMVQCPPYLLQNSAASPAAIQPLLLAYMSQNSACTAEQAPSPFRKQLPIGSSLPGSEQSMEIERERQYMVPDLRVFTVQGWAGRQTGAPSSPGVDRR